MKFFSEFLTKISEHFYACFRLIGPITMIWASLEDIFLLSILDNGDDISGTKANVHHSQLQLAQALMG